MTEILRDQKKVNFNVDDDFKILFNRVAENMGFSEEAAITDVVYRCFRRMDEKYKPDISKKEDLQKIQDLENDLTRSSELLKKKEEDLVLQKKENDELHQKIADIKSNLQDQELNSNDILLKMEKDHQSELDEKDKFINNLSHTIENLQKDLDKKIGLMPGEMIIGFTEIQKAYLEKLIEDKKFREFVKEINKKGTFNGLIDNLEGNEKDLVIALKSWMFYSAKLEKYPLISFDRFLKLFKTLKADE